MYDGTVDLTTTNHPRTQIVSLVAPSSRVLEIGCGTGSVAEYLQHEKGCDVTCLEVDEASCAVARAKGLKVVHGDVERDESTADLGGGFDYVICGDVIEHLVDTEGALRRLGALLKDGGELIASIPNVGHVSVRTRLLFGRFDYTDGGILDKNHLRFFTRNSIRRVFDRCGFGVEIGGVYAMPRLVALPEAGKRMLWRALPELFTYQYIVRSRKKS